MIWRHDEVEPRDCLPHQPEQDRFVALAQVMSCVRARGCRVDAAGARTAVGRPRRHCAQQLIAEVRRNEVSFERGSCRGSKPAERARIG
jgi:hypothetical protein